MRFTQWFWLLFFTLLTPLNAFAGGVFPSGTDMFSILQNLNLNDVVKIVSGSADPTIVAPESAPAGSLYLQTNGSAYIKQDAGSTTNWAVLAGGSGSGITTLNTLTGATQTFATGVAGTDFAVVSSGTTHTFNIPTVSASARGLVTSALKAVWDAKQAAGNYITALTGDGSLSGFSGGSATLTLANTAVTPASYTAANITVDSKGRITAAANGSAGITALTGDVTASGTGSVAATVASVGGSTASNVHAAELLANAATNANTASTIIKRDSSHNFSAGIATLASGQFGGASSGGSVNAQMLVDGITTGINLQSQDGTKTEYMGVENNGNAFLYNGSDVQLAFSGGLVGTGPAGPLSKFEANYADPNTTTTTIDFQASLSSRNINNTIGNAETFAMIDASQAAVAAVQAVNIDQAGTATLNLSTAITGTMGIRVIIDDVKSIFNGGVTVNSSQSQPSCASGLRGTIWVVQGGPGVADIVQMCLKDVTNSYAWHTVTIP